MLRIKSCHFITITIFYIFVCSLKLYQYLKYMCTHQDSSCVKAKAERTERRKRQLHTCSWFQHSTRQLIERDKVNKDVDYLIPLAKPIQFKRTECLLTEAEYTFFSSVCWLLTYLGHVLNHKMNDFLKDYLLPQ